MRRNTFSRLFREKDGVAAIEFAFLLPVILVIVIAAVTIFLFFRDSKIAEKSTFTVGDIISRRTTVDTDFLNSSYQLFLRMTNRQAAQVSFRVSSLTKASGAFSVAWSYAVAPQVALTSGNIPTTKLPLVTDGDSLILVETVVTPPAIRSYLPITVSDYNSIEFVRPRFTSAIAKTN